ncbi:MAG TPA: glycerate kinase [Bacteroidota bacterium]|nr:glycerate kinase [Bacteroidota bacterium]
MNFLIAPNALKGSLSAYDAAAIIARSLKRVHPNARCVLAPIADGGDGTLDCLVRATKGRCLSARVQGPIDSMIVNARWGILGDGKTAVIETAEAAGLRLLKPSQYDAAHATTFGVGQLMLRAAAAGCKKIIVGLGGSATNDGGAGCARALGVRFFDKDGDELPNGGAYLRRLHRIDIKNDRLKNKSVKVIGLSDVSNVLCGSHGAAFTFGPQKGATSQQVRTLDTALRHYASIIERDLDKNIFTLPGSGAAGGLGGGLIAFCGAQVVSGVEYILDSMRFDKLLKECDCVITAEGKIDSQTFRGKGIDGIAHRASLCGKPVYAFTGKIEGNSELLQKRLRLKAIHQISPKKMKTENAMRNAEALLSQKIQEVFTNNYSD